MKPTTHEKARRLLERALPILRCPACAAEKLALPDVGANGLICRGCERRFGYAGGVLNLYTGPEVFTLGQRSLQTTFSTWLYERCRGLLTKVLVGYTAAEELERFRATLDLKPGDALLDVACGPANFTIPLARFVGPGLTIGLDISPAQLARAAANVARSNVDNVLLIRGDVHCLPLRNGSLAKVNCAGGLHQFPHPARALGEVARIMPAGGRFSGSTFARHPARWACRIQDWLRRRSDVHFVDLAAFARVVEGAGLRDYRHEAAPIPWFGYYRAAKV